MVRRTSNIPNVTELSCEVLKAREEPNFPRRSFCKGSGSRVIRSAIGFNKSIYERCRREETYDVSFQNVHFFRAQRITQIEDFETTMLLDSPGSRM